MNEQRIPGPAVELGPDRRIAPVEAVPREQQEQPGRIAAANLEPVKRGESLLNRDEDIEPGIAGAGRRQCAHFGGGPQPIAANRPFGVGERRGGAVHGLKARIAEAGGGDIEASFQPVHRRRAGPQCVGDRGPQRFVAHQGPHGRPSP